MIGTSVAYHLAKAGVRTCLVEAKGLASGTSSSCDGGILTQTKKPGIHLDLALESIRYLQYLAPTLPIDVEMCQEGSLIIAGSEEELPILEGVMAFQSGRDLEIEYWTNRKLRAFEPAFSNRVIAATFCSKDGSLNPYYLALAFAISAEEAGCQVATWAPVVDFIIQSGNIVGVRTSRGEIRANMVVLAAGVHSSELAAKIDLHLPVVPARGQIVVIEPLGKIAGGIVVGVDYLLKKHNDLGFNQAYENGNIYRWDQEPPGGFTLECTKSGTVLIGGTKEFVGFDKRVTPQGVHSIVRRALRMVPSLENFRCIRTYAGLRPQTPDGLPIIGKPHGLGGMYVVTGHSGDGIALAAITGKLVAEELRGQYHPDLLTRFSPNRFLKNPRRGFSEEQ